MTPAEKIQQMIQDMADLYKQDLTPGVLRRYVKALADISPERIDRAIDAWILTSHFFPQPDELREANAQLPLTPEEQARAREKLLARIDWEPKQLRSTTEKFLERVNPTETPEAPPPPGADMTPEQWQEHLQAMKEKFLKKYPQTTRTPETEAKS